VNRNEGREFQDWLKSQYTAEGDNEVKSGAKEYSVQRVTDITEHTEEAGSS